MNENITLIAELNAIRDQLHEAKMYTYQMETLLGISNKSVSSSSARNKLSKALEDYDKIEQKHTEEISKFEEIIKTLTSENHTLRSNLIEISKKAN